MTQGPNKTCSECGGVTRYVQWGVRCLNEQCPAYWLNQGGIESLEPNPPAPAQVGEALPIIIRKPPGG